MIERAVEYGGSAVEKPSVSEFARMMRERLFDHFDPDFYKWTQAVAWNLRLEPDHSVGDTITVMEEMGFTVIPPAAKRYEVLYNGVHVAQFDSPSHAETLSMGRTGYKVIDHGAAR